MRLSALTALGPRLLDFSASDDVQEMQVGTTLAATGTDFDSTANVANWGNAELIYARNASVAILPGTIVVMDKNFEVVATSASEANSGRPIYVAVTYFAAGSTTPQYGRVRGKGRRFPGRFLRGT